MHNKHLNISVLKSVRCFAMLNVKKNIQEGDLRRTISFQLEESFIAGLIITLQACTHR